MKKTRDEMKFSNIPYFGVTVAFRMNNLKFLKKTKSVRHDVELLLPISTYV